MHFQQLFIYENVKVPYTNLRIASLDTQNHGSTLEKWTDTLFNRSYRHRRKKVYEYAVFFLQMGGY